MKKTGDKFEKSLGEYVKENRYCKRYRNGYDSFFKNWRIKYDFGGYSPYKNAFHPEISEILIVHKSYLPGLHMMKNLAKKIISLLRK